MSVSNPQKVIVPAEIGCSGSAEVRMCFRASPGGGEEPMELMLVLDRSCSMSCERMEHMKAGVRELLDLFIGERGCFRGGMQAGLVSFADEAAADVLPTREVQPVLEALEHLTAGGRTAHADAFRRALESFTPGSRMKKVLVLFTDGGTNAGDDPDAAARLVREAGVELYCLGLGIDRQPLLEWASEPGEQHVFRAERSDGLEELFLQLGGVLRHAGAAQAVIRERVSRDFRITEIEPPARGTVQLLDRRTLLWDIGTVGLEQEEWPSLTYRVTHVGRTGGEKETAEFTEYRDRAGNQLIFPNPSVFVDCSCGPICPEPCGDPIQFCLDSCQSCSKAELGDVCLGNTGRIVEVSTTVRNVCPGKRVALAVTLSEAGKCGEEYPRGMKTITIPAHHGRECRDVEVRCIRFVVPDDLEPCACGGLCRPRRFLARVMANYLDTDFICCSQDTAVL